MWSWVPARALSGSAWLGGKHNFRKFVIANKRGTRLQREAAAAAGVRDWRGRAPGQGSGPTWRPVPDMRPQLVVPELAGTRLRPYVSYRAPDVQQSPFGPRELFHAVYAPKLAADLRDDQLDPSGQPLQPSPEEKRTAEEAYQLARKTGSDIFG